MKHIAATGLLTLLCVGLSSSEVFGQNGPLTVTFQNAATDPSGPTSVAAGDDIALGIGVEGGTPPYTVTITDEGPVVGGSFPETTYTGNGPDFQFDYSAPSDDVGVASFTVSATDAAATTEMLLFTVPVVCPGQGLCTEKLTNQELAGLGVLDFEPEVIRNIDGVDVVVDPGTLGTRLFPANLPPANILNRLDIDKDGAPDNIGDTDGDGLPDNWELGGVEPSDRVVFFPAPSAIIPGTPPTEIFTRRAVASSAISADTDGDGLSDFVEVFGLKYIDEDGDGRLDANEWMDFNQDGLPSIGEYPLNNVALNPDGSPKPNQFGLLHDFDGFMFTDPANADTDGDGVKDGVDNDPLINPRSFGNTSTFFVRFNRSDDPDIDKDGLGNGMDMGNDIRSTDAPGTLDFVGIDNPANMRELLDLFRDDLLGDGVVPESVVEDLLGADWDGNGLWRTTDVQDWLIVVDPDVIDTRPPDQFFALDPDNLDDTPFFYTSQKLKGLSDEETAAGKFALLDLVNGAGYQRYNGRGIGLGWQDLLRPPSTTEFIPDKRIWAILYAWRMPGFDIDGDGFVGVPNFSTAAEFPNGPPPAVGTCEEIAGSLGLKEGAVRNSFTVLTIDPVQDIASPGCPPPVDTARPFDDRIRILEDLEGGGNGGLDGVIDAPGLSDFFGQFGCGGFGAATLSLLFLGLGLTTFYRRR